MSGSLQLDPAAGVRTARLVGVEDVSSPAVLYRVGHRSGGDGLWYGPDGRATRAIDTVDRAAAAALPMGPHPIFGYGGQRWVSAAGSIEALGRWFPARDMRQLAARGYVVQEVAVSGYRRLTFEGYAHEVYCQTQVISCRVIIR